MPGFVQYRADSIELADVRGWLNDDEGRCLAKYAQGKRVLEVGSYCGRSTIWMARVARRVYAIDTWQEGTKDEFLSNLDRYQVRNVSAKDGPAQSMDWVSILDMEGFFDFIFIDADHSFEAVTADIQTCLPLLAPGGLLALHDFQSHTDPGPTEAAYNLMAAGAQVVEQVDMVLVLKP